jgi:hypothetical protein
MNLDLKSSYRRNTNKISHEKCILKPGLKEFPHKDPKKPEAHTHTHTHTHTHNANTHTENTLGSGETITEPQMETF